MKQLVLEPTSTAQWYALVNEAERARDCKLDETMESYLVFLLMRFATRPDMAARVMALDYLNGMSARGRLQVEQLRDVGDHCLLYSGLYPRRVERRAVRLSYFVGLGRSSYHQISHLLHHGGAQVYEQLADMFVTLMEVLHAMRALDGHAVLDPLSAAELWQDTGSRGARQALQEVTDGTPVPSGTRRPH
ncbi:MAG: hypothetical protein WCC36_04555 [Gammaproteobacteria bacterium]